VRVGRFAAQQVDEIAQALSAGRIGADLGEVAFEQGRSQLDEGGKRLVADGRLRILQQEKEGIDRIGTVEVAGGVGGGSPDGGVVVLERLQERLVRGGVPLAGESIGDRPESVGVGRAQRGSK
jgi:hypothetical protein